MVTVASTWLSKDIDGHHELEYNITPHIMNALTAGNAVDIGILQPAQVALIAAVQQVFGCDVQLGNLPAILVFLSRIGFKYWSFWHKNFS